MEIRVRERPRRVSNDGSAEAILEAAEKLLARVPLQDLSVAAIIEEAGVARATFYKYFASKFAVLTDLLKRSTEEIFEACQPFLSSEGPDAQANLRGALGSVAEVWARHSPVMQAVSEHLGTDEAVRELWQQVIEQFVDAFSGLIDAEKAAGRVDPGVDTRMLAAALCWATERIFYVSTINSDTRLQSPPQVADVLTRIWLGAIYGVNADVGEPKRTRRR